jgi:hypothetical protein
VDLRAEPFPLCRYGYRYLLRLRLLILMMVTYLHIACATRCFTVKWSVLYSHEVKHTQSTGHPMVFCDSCQAIPVC